ncbi:MAG: helix-turn-helix transcriptional regulator [Cytophagales bacterium]|nr:helix-turn-helix transcriptional regulator [Cytophagales bacterium]
MARLYFTVPFILIGFYYWGVFFQKVSRFPKSNEFTSRRSRLSITSVGCIVLLPLLTLIGDYQWLTFTVMNIAFFAFTAIEIDRYLFILENKNKMYEVFAFYKENKEKLWDTKLVYQNLTRREMEIAVSILSKESYKEIGEDFFIAERTVSKHASNIFKKTGVNNKTEFLNRFGPSKS